MPERHHPSLKAMIMNDYVAFLAVVFPVVMFGIVLAIQLFGSIPDLQRGRRPVGPEGIPVFLLLGLAALVIGAIVVVWRYRRAHEYFQHGVEVPGTIVKHWRFRDRGRVYYQYVYGNHEYTTSAPVHFSRAVQELENGRKIHVFLKHGDPTKSLLMELYV